MDLYKVVVTKQAEESMREIAIYIATELKNVTAAEGHVNAFLQEIDNLSYLATSVPPIPEKPWGEMGFRRIGVKNYFIYFRADETQKTVSVIDIIYQGRDQSKALGESN